MSQIPMPPYLRLLVFFNNLTFSLAQSYLSHLLKRQSPKLRESNRRMPSKHLMMHLDGSSKQKNQNLPSSVTANEYPEDAKALWIMFKGREYIILHWSDHFTSYPCDNLPVTDKEIQRLYYYLKHEGFITDSDEPTPNP